MSNYIEFSRFLHRPYGLHIAAQSFMGSRRHLRDKHGVNVLPNITDAALSHSNKRRIVEAHIKAHRRAEEEESER